jgi:hypothetical protein
VPQQGTIVLQQGAIVLQQGAIVLQQGNRAAARGTPSRDGMPSTVGRRPQEQHCCSNHAGTVGRHRRHVRTRHGPAAIDPVRSIDPVRCSQQSTAAARCGTV